MDRLSHKLWNLGGWLTLICQPWFSATGARPCGQRPYLRPPVAAFWGSSSQQILDWLSLIQKKLRWVMVESTLVDSYCLVTQLCPALCYPMDYSRPGFPVLHHLPEFAHTHVIESVMPSNHLILCHPRLLLPSIFLQSLYIDVQGFFFFFFSKFFPILVTTEYWVEFPGLYSRSFVVIYFVYSSVCMSGPNSQFVTAPPAFPLW